MFVNYCSLIRAKSPHCSNHTVLRWEAKEQMQVNISLILLFDPFYFYLECWPVGVTDRNAISDARMTASSFYNKRYYPYSGRLHENRGWGGWCPKTVSDRTDYLQVDMGTMLSVCAVATQGEKVYHEWTTSYKLHLSSDGVTWNVYEETSAAKVRSATICNEYRTAKSPIQ